MWSSVHWPKAEELHQHALVIVDERETITAAVGYVARFRHDLDASGAQVRRGLLKVVDRNC